MVEIKEIEEKILEFWKKDKKVNPIFSMMAQLLQQDYPIMDIYLHLF